MKQPYKGVFETMDFPPYKYQEYPKWVTKIDGSRVVVETQADEVRMLSELAPEEEAVKTNTVIVSQAKEIEDLKKKLAEMTPKAPLVTPAKTTP